MKQAADDSKRETLQKLIFNCIDLAHIFKHCHWNVRGTLFSPLHKFLDEVYETLLETSDDIAERMQALDYPSDGLVYAVAAQSSLATLPSSFLNRFLPPDTIVKELTSRLTQLTGMFNEAIKATEADAVTSNMLQDQTHTLEKHLWMLRSQKKNADQAAKYAAAAALKHLGG